MLSVLQNIPFPASLDKNFTALKNLEFLDLSSNNFQKIPDEINPTNFPKLRTLLMGANTRRNIYDLSNTVETNYGGLVDEEGFPRRMIEWDLDTLQLSVNYLQGPLPKMDDWEKYTEQDIIDADTLPPAKARILLALALLKTKDRDEIRRMFREY